MKLDLRMGVDAPAGNEPNQLVVKSATREAQKLGGPAPEVTSDPFSAVAGADVVYTDVWASMGQEAEAQVRLEAFEGFTVTAEMMASASPEAVLMPCPPAHPGAEVAAEGLGGPPSA